jgi:phosphorylase kinase alpha/beta subunit
MKKESLVRILHSLRTENGLYRASLGEYYCQYAWIRDVYFCAMPELTLNPENYKQTYQTLMDYYINMENKHKKLSSLIKSPTKYSFEYPHPRFYPLNLEEIDQQWSFKQLDNFGQFLHGIWLGESNGIKIIRDDKDRKIINLLIEILDAIEYEKCENSSYWEESEEVRQSSIGACVCGLASIRMLGFDVSQELIDKGLKAMGELGTDESKTRKYDLATLSLIYPHNIVSPKKAYEIIHNVERELLRDMGVIRYHEDVYYNLNNTWDAQSTKRLCQYGLEENKGHEAEWCFGYGFLGLSYFTLGDLDKATYYLKRLAKCEYGEGKLPELYYSNTNIAGDNNPLGWTNAMGILLMEALGYEEI